tara:strand:- start:4563 stop:5276 length:714 start_codon:yes stop_codon:yes gene_type:complete
MQAKYGFASERNREAQMNKIVPLDSTSNVPGVRPAGQKRSRLLQDRFVIAGRKILIETRLKDVSIPTLAAKAGSSVGGFYSRFDSKEVYFNFMRSQMFEEHTILHDQYLDPAKFQTKTHKSVSIAFVDLMLEMVSGPWRGVLREAFLSVPDDPEGWGPMKHRSEHLCDRLLKLYEPLVENKKALDQRVTFAVQLVISAVDTASVNSNLKFGISDLEFRDYLIESFNALITGNFQTAT